MLNCPTGGMEVDHGPGPGRHYLPVGKSDPLALVSGQKLVADSPIGCFVPAPVGMDLPCNVGR
jgi:hypothetical protein